MSEKDHQNEDLSSVCSCCSTNSKLEECLKLIQNIGNNKDKIELFDEKINYLREKINDQQIISQQNKKIQELHLNIIEEKNKNALLELKVKNYENKNQSFEKIETKEKQLCKENKETHFVFLPNKIYKIDINNTCCEYKCINKNFVDGSCISDFGYINVKNIYSVIYIEYINKARSWDDKPIRLFAQNSFTNQNKISDCYSLYYYEIKLTKATMEYGCLVDIGLLNSDKYYNITLCSNTNSTYTFDDGDVYGCGIVFPPINIQTNKKPYIFFTKNGNKIYKEKLFENQDYDLCPAISLYCCSVEINFGNNLKEKPFVYKCSQHKY